MAHCVRITTHFSCLCLNAIAIMNLAAEVDHIETAPRWVRPTPWPFQWLDFVCMWGVVGDQQALSCGATFLRSAQMNRAVH